jgi:CobQ-like glutamine amidotransferase family enzyme
VENDKLFLAICGGYQLLGHSYTTWDGKTCSFIGAINITTVGRKERMIGNYMFRLSEEDGGTIVVGFENHSGRTYLGEGVRPLGTVLSGFGNNGEDGTEGARYKNVFCSYSHGSLLPKNPGLCDLMLELALKSKYGEDISLPPLDDALEIRAHDYMEKLLYGKA